MDFLNQPFTRDTTPNSFGEILRRLATLAHPLCLIGGALVAGFGLLQRSGGEMAGGAAVFGAGLALHLTRRRWRVEVPGRPLAKSGRQAGESSATATTGRTSVSAAARAERAIGAAVEAGREVAGAGETRRPRILLLNGSLAGATGNSARLLARMETGLAGRAEISRATF